MSVPKTKDGQGGQDAKINAAYAWGGIPLMVQTVEKFTQVRIDHVALIDFAGFKDIVDALGGVEIDVAEGFTSTHSLNPDGRRTFVKGRQTMDGAAAWITRASATRSPMGTSPESSTSNRSSRPFWTRRCPEACSPARGR